MYCKNLEELQSKIYQKLKVQIPLENATSTPKSPDKNSSGFSL